MNGVVSVISISGISGGGVQSTDPWSVEHGSGLVSASVSVEVAATIPRRTSPTPQSDPGSPEKNASAFELMFENVALMP